MCIRDSAQVGRRMWRNLFSSLAVPHCSVLRPRICHSERESEEREKAACPLIVDYCSINFQLIYHLSLIDVYEKRIKKKWINDCFLWLVTSRKRNSDVCFLVASSFPFFSFSFFFTLTHSLTPLGISLVNWHLNKKTKKKKKKKKRELLLTRTRTRTMMKENPDHSQSRLRIWSSSINMW